MDAEAAFTDDVVFGETSSCVNGATNGKRYAKVKKKAVIEKVDTESLSESGINSITGRSYDSKTMAESVEFRAKEITEGMDVPDEIDDGSKWLCEIHLLEYTVTCNVSVDPSLFGETTYNYSFRLSTFGDWVNRYQVISAGGQSVKESVENAFYKTIDTMNEKIEENERIESALERHENEMDGTIESLDLKKIEGFSDVDW